MTNLPDSFTYSFTSSKPAAEIFTLLLNIDNWWSGLYSENTNGKSERLGDEFSFRAGGGAHYSKQKLVERIPNSKIVWLVVESNLNFINDATEWKDTKICFDIQEETDHTKVTFTHEGLIPQIECYDNCSSAWTQYLTNLKKKLA